MKVLFLPLALALLARNVNGNVDGCVVQSSGAYTECVVNNCPAEAEACGVTQLPDDTCEDFQESCRILTAECCPPCGTELTTLLDCSLPFCGGFEDCGAPPASDVVPTPAAGDEIDGFGDCLFDVVEVYTTCVVNKCPAQADTCTFTTDQDDTCEEFQAGCKALTAECCPECGDELALLLNCVLGFCPDFETCSATGTPASDASNAQCARCLAMPAESCEEICGPATAGDTAEAECFSCLLEPAMSCEEICGNAYAGDEFVSEADCVKCLAADGDCEKTCNEAFQVMDEATSTEAPGDTTEPGETTEPPADTSPAAIKKIGMAAVLASIVGAMA